MCSARLRYRYNNSTEMYELEFWNLKHIHLFSARRKRNESIINYINSVPELVSQSSLKHIVMNEFSISEATFYYLFKKAVHPKISYCDLIRHLENHNCYVQSEPWARNM